MFVCIFFFFFKQKTAYEMRISDWSSDVRSSDLETEAATNPIVQALRRGNLPLFELLFSELTHLRTPQLQRIVYGGRGEDLAIVCRAVGVDKLLFGSVYMRSEEHTSELQSLMRNSYAVFCLKKKNNNTLTPT